VVFRSLSEGGGGVRRETHLVHDVSVGPRGEEEFHDTGVTFPRGQDERRPPILKERTQRERRQRMGERQHQQQHTHTHDEGTRREEVTEAP
jgi:hypothetical protein